MATCLPRSVLGAGDRPARIKKAADTVTAAANNLQKRVLPHAGSPRRGGGMGSDPFGDALRALARGVDAFAREVSDALSEQAQQAREDAQTAAALEAGAVAIRVVYQPYTEPMSIPLPNLSVAAISCARVVVTQAPNEFLLSGAAVDWQSGNGDITVRSIDGLTPGDPRILTFTFIYFGV